MKLECFLLKEHTIDIRPGKKKRAWMDDTPNAFVYRCLPLVMANMHGWEIRCLSSFEAQWNGGRKREDLEVFSSDQHSINNVSSHFGNGILTFHGSAVFRTPPDYNLWVMGPANRFKDGIQAMSALIETDWMP